VGYAQLASNGVQYMWL